MKIAKIAFYIIATLFAVVAIFVYILTSAIIFRYTTQPHNEVEKSSQPGGSGNTAALGPCSGQTTLTGQNISLINQNMDVYKQAAAQANVPWEMLAAIHYREHNNDPNPPPGNVDSGGPFQFDPPPPGVNVVDFEPAAIYAGGFLQGKVGNQLTQDTTDVALIKDAFWGYNGRAYVSADNSPYVMNNWDENHRNMHIIGTVAGTPVDTIDQRDGALKIYFLLKKALYGPDGKITQLQGC